MPASGFDIFYVQDARNNFDAMRPAPVFADANQVVGQCQPIHVSTNCYYGYHHEAKMLPAQTDDCEMMEVVPAGRPSPLPYSPQPRTSLPHAGRKRSATDDYCPVTKRLREEQVQTKKINEKETNERIRLDQKQTEDEFMESLFWNTHGGNVYQLLQCS